ncbi:3-oxoacyl-acyl-carrier-protein reductase [Aphelenchoides avenae]|nr:3-oxoacyl-acyl-carrier-protein reductase [Aphelenchus avenae]
MWIPKTFESFGHRRSSVQFEHSVAIITSATSGIGQAAAVAFAREGSCVTIHGRSAEGLKKTTELIKALGVPPAHIEEVVGPLDEDKTLDSLVKKTVKKFGRIDVLVNCVDAAGKPGVASDSMENFDYVFNVNLRAIVRLTLLAVPFLEKTKGCVINVSDVASEQTSPSTPFCGMAMSALDQFCRSYAVALAPKGIRVSNVSVEPTAKQLPKSPINGNKVANGTNGRPPKSPSQLSKRNGTADEIVTKLLFLASDAASNITGANIVRNGGSTPRSASANGDQ